MGLKLGDLVDNFNRSSKILYAHRSSNALSYWLPKQITSYHWLFKMRAKRAAASVSKKERQKKIQWSYDKMLIDWVRSGRAGKYLALGQDARNSLRSVHTSWPRAKYFSVRPSHSVNKYIISYSVKYCFNTLENKIHIFASPCSILFLTKFMLKHCGITLSKLKGKYW